MEVLAGGCVADGECMLPGGGVLLGGGCWANAALESTVSNMNRNDDFMSDLLWSLSRDRGDGSVDCTGPQARRVPLEASLRETAWSCSARVTQLVTEPLVFRSAGGASLWMFDRRRARQLLSWLRAVRLELRGDVHRAQLADPRFRVVAGFVQLARGVTTAEVTVWCFDRGIPQQNGRVPFVLLARPPELEGAGQLHIEPLQILHRAVSPSTPHPGLVVRCFLCCIAVHRFEAIV